MNENIQILRALVRIPDSVLVEADVERIIKYANMVEDIVELDKSLGGGYMPFEGTMTDTHLKFLRMAVNLNFENEKQVRTMVDFFEASLETTKEPSCDNMQCDCSKLEDTNYVYERSSGYLGVRCLTCNYWGYASEFRGIPK